MARRAATSARNSRRRGREATGLSSRCASSRRALSRCAWASARRLRSAAWSLARQHFLYLLPLPQWQGSLRPGFGAGLAMRVGIVVAGRTHPLYRDLLANATFRHLLLAFDGDLADACAPEVQYQGHPMAM